MRCYARWVLAVLVLSPLGSTARAWHDKGHKVTALIAYRSLRPATRDRVVGALNKHVAYTSGNWAGRIEPGTDPDASLFLFASVFPDDARKDGPFHEYHVPDAHFIDIPYFPDRGDRKDPTIRIEDPYAPNNLVKAYCLRVGEIKSASVSDAGKALALSWVFHLVGDIHQPLHSVTLYSRHLRSGDRGGNTIRFAPGLAARTGQANLHAYWDGLPGEDHAFANVEAKASEVMMKHPEGSLDLTRDVVEEWMTESFGLARSRVYAGLTGAGTMIDDLPAGYEDAARPAADLRLAQAGYRLARVLEDLYGEP
jgi:hypothetical protein